MLSNKVYDVLKIVAQFVLPAAATLYFGLAKIWGLPYSEQIVGSILALDVFVGTIIGISVVQYNKQMARYATYGGSVVDDTEKVESSTVLDMSHSAYDILYWVTNVVVPAVGTLYFALASLWPLPYGEQIVGTIALIDTVLGIFLGISTAEYNRLNP